MNKNEFLRAIADKTESTIKDATAFYEAFVETVTEAMKADDKITLVGFGTFEVREKPAREGINPQTKEKVSIPASKAPALKFGKAYKDLFN